MTARDIMIKEFDTLLPSSTVKMAAKLFKHGKRGGDRSGVKAIIVIDEKGQLAGVITLFHILKAIIPFYMEMAHLAEFAWEGLFAKMCGKIQDRPVSDFMEKKVVTITQDANLLEIADLMIKKRFRGLPVVDGEKVIGIVYRTELFFKMVDNMIDKEVD